MGHLPAFLASHWFLMMKTKWIHSQTLCSQQKLYLYNTPLPHCLRELFHGGNEAEVGLCAVLHTFLHKQNRPQCAEVRAFLGRPWCVDHTDLLEHDTSPQLGEETNIVFCAPPGKANKGI